MLGAVAGFDPATLSPIYLTHTDDTNVVSGGADSIVDRIAGATFISPGSTNRPIVNTTEIPGHKVWQLDDSTTARKHLICNNHALAALLDGPVPFTFVTWLKVVHLPSIGTPNLIGHTLNTTSYSNPSVRYGLTTTGANCVISGATRTQTLTKTPITYSGDWQLLSMRYDGALSLDFWLDDTQLGAPVPLLAPGEMTGQTNIVLGDATANNSLNGRLYYVGVQAAFPGRLSAANLKNMTGWCRSKLPVDTGV